jgi:hypothetical protein
MMTIQLNEFWSQRLAKLPESGMGYQKAKIFLKGNRVIENVVIFNAEECQTNEKFNPADIIDVEICRHKD